MRINVKSDHFSASDKLIQYIEKKVSKLDALNDRITLANIVLKLENSGQVKDKIVEIKLTIPKNMMIAKGASKSFENAIYKAVSSLKRRLIKHKEIRAQHILEGRKNQSL